MFTCTKCENVKPETLMIGPDPGSGIEGVCTDCWREYVLSFDSFTALLTIEGHSEAIGDHCIKIGGPYEVAQEVDLIELLSVLAGRVVMRGEVRALLSLRAALKEVAE